MTGRRIAKTLCIAFAAAAAIGGTTNAIAGSSQNHKTCVSDTHMTLMKQKLPQIYEDFQQMAALPLTGQPVYKVLSNPHNDIKTCLVPPSKNTWGQYWTDSNTLNVTKRDTGIATFSHENFHADQDMRGVFDTTYGNTLTRDDYITESMLIEACAEAYAYTTYKEARIFGPDAHASFQMAYTDFDMDGIFDRAFNDAWKKYSNADEKIRKEKSLEAGGKAIVRAFLNGKSAMWSGSYSYNSIDSARYFASNKNALNPGYEAFRRQLFYKTGEISPQINIVPDGLLGKNASQKIVAVDKMARSYS